MGTCRRCGGTALTETPSHPFLLFPEFDPARPSGPPSGAPLEARVTVANVGVCGPCIDVLRQGLQDFFGGPVLPLKTNRFLPPNEIRLVSPDTGRSVRIVGLTWPS